MHKNIKYKVSWDTTYPIEESKIQKVVVSFKDDPDCKCDKEEYLKDGIENKINC